MTEKTAAPLVLKLSGKALGAEAELDRLFRALKAARRTFLLVHGGGVEVDHLMERLNLPVRRIEGLRVSPAEDMPVIAGGLAGACSLALRGAVRRAGLTPLGLLVTDGGAAEVVPQDAALGRVAKTRAGSEAGRRALLGLIDAGWTPVVSSIGMDVEGRLWNINADDAALSVAELLAAPLVYLSDVPGVLDHEKRLIATLDAEGVEALIESGVVTGGMAVKVRAALSAARATGAPVSIASIFDAALPDVAANGGFPGTVMRA